MPEFQIQHQPEQNLFFVPLDDGQSAFIKYRHSDDRSASSEVDFWSTFVPDSYRGQGLAAQLVDHAFAWAEENGYHFRTSCWYAAKRMQARQQA